MKFVPLPQFMVSYDVVPVFGATIKWSSPASPLAVSKPLPGSKRSSPSPPFSVSLALRPESLSEPPRPLRRLMHNRSDQKVGQVAQRSPELVVEPLPAGVGRHLGRQAGQKTFKRLGPVALQGEEVLELIYDPFDDL